MALIFNQQADTETVVFEPLAFMAEKSQNFPTGADLLIQVRGDYPVWVSDTSGVERGGFPVFPGVPVVVDNPEGDLFIYSGDGPSVAHITPGILAD